MSFRHLIATVLIVILFPAASHAEIRYAVTNLGGLGGRWTQPFAINESGQVAGLSYTASGLNHAYLYDGSAIIDIIPAGQVGSYPTGAGNGLNGAGQVVGYYAPNWPDPPHAFVWRAATGLHDLGTLGGLTSHARAINDHGQAVGDADTGSATEPGPTHAFIWNESSGMTDLGALAGHSLARAINNAGEVVGRTGTPDGFERGFFWSQSTGMVALGTLGGRHSEALGVNNAGQIVGYAYTAFNDGNSQEHAFLFDPSCGMADLGTLGGNSSEALGVNDHGWVVGDSLLPEGSAEQVAAFVYDGTTMWNLNDLIDPSLGYTLYYAYDINNAGQIVVEAADPSRAVRALLLTPIPEPNAALLAMTAATGAAAGGSRRAGRRRAMH